MLIVEPGFEIGKFSYVDMVTRIHNAGKTCYKSSLECSFGEQEEFIYGTLIKQGHESVLEHCNITVKIICDRGVSHELVRHRIASYSQESTRYCNYSKDRFGKQITVIKPVFFPELKCGEYCGYSDFHNYESKIQIWSGAMITCERRYFYLLDKGCSPQEARSVLPNSLKTEIVMTQNIRQWRHFFKLRALGLTGKPHPQMLEIAVPMLEEFKRQMTVFFNDLEVKDGSSS